MRIFRASRAVALVLLVGVWACGDAGPGPAAVVMTPETRAAVGLGLELPSFPPLLDDAVAVVRRPASGGGTSAESAAVVPEDGLPAAFAVRSPAASGRAPLVSLREEAARWEATWLMESARGREARGRIYDRAAGPVATALGEERIRSILNRLDRVARAVDDAELTDLPSEYRARLDEVRDLAAWGSDALDRGDPPEALRAALEGADRLRSMSPERVAGVLLARARRGLDDASDRESIPAERRDRIERLVRGAGNALERGEHPLAIRRAYYACRLLGLPVF